MRAPNKSTVTFSSTPLLSATASTSTMASTFPLTTTDTTPIVTLTSTLTSTSNVMSTSNTSMSNVMSTSNVTSMSNVTSASNVKSTATLPDTTAEKSNVAENWADITSRFDSQQLKFEMGPASRSPGKVTGHVCVKSPTSGHTGHIQAPAGTASTTGLFGSDIVAEAFRAPSRFNFKGNSQAPNPIHAPSTSSDGQRRKAPSNVDVTRTSASNSVQSNLQGTSKQALASSTIRKLGPDVVIRPVSFANRHRTSHEEPPRPSKAGSEDAESSLVAGYKCLKEEVASLKVQLASSQALMQEILTNFSAEIARINVRLTTMEQKTEQRREQEEKSQNLQEREKDECLNMLGKLDLTKENTNK